MNLSRLAKLAGCSLSTVSKAFKNSPEISNDTKERIFKLAKEHNCYTKYYTPVLQKKVFALLCSEVSSLFYSSVIESIEKNISENGDILLVSIGNFVQSKTEELIDYYINFHKVDGLILMFNTGYDIKGIKNTPTVAIGHQLDKLPKISYYCDYVSSDNHDAIYQAVSYLKNMGHKKIGFIGEYHTAKTSEKFEEALKYYKIPINKDWIAISSKRKGEAGYDGMDKIIANSSRPTAVFAAYDSIALGAVNRIYKAGLKVPDDISIIGNNDIPLARFGVPPLTTITVPIQNIADAATELLYKRIKYNNNTPYQKVFFQSSLTIRDSVKNLNEKF